MKLRIALEAETIARLRAEWELTAQKQLAANLRNLLNNFVGSQRALELQINTIEGGVEDDPGSSSLGEELGLPEHDVNPLSSWEEFDAAKLNPSPNHKLCPSVKKLGGGTLWAWCHWCHLPYSLEEGFDSAKPTPLAPIPNAAIKRQSQLWWYHTLQQILLICKGKLAIFLKKIILKLFWKFQ